MTAKLPVKLTVESQKFPGIQFAGFPHFAVGAQYDITEEDKTAILRQMPTFPPAVRDHIKLHFHHVGLAAADASVRSPQPPPAPPSEEEPENEPPVEDLTELTDEDLELVEIEVQKLLGRTIPEAEPQLIATGGNPELPRALRVNYLQRVIEHPEVKKGLKTTAEKLLEQI